MANRRRFTSRKTLAWIMILGLGSLAAISWIARDALLERWYLVQLESNDVVKQDNACHALGRLKSSLAVPRLLDLLEERPGNPPFLTPPGSALCEIGEPAAERLVARLEAAFADFDRFADVSKEDPFALVLEHLLERLGADASEAIGAALGRTKPRVDVVLVSLIDKLGPAGRDLMVPLFRLSLTHADSELSAVTVRRLLAAFPQDIPSVIDATGGSDGDEVIERIRQSLPEDDCSPGRIKRLREWIADENPRLRRLAIAAWNGFLFQCLRGSATAEWLEDVANQLAVLYRDDESLRSRIMELGEASDHVAFRIFEVSAGRWESANPEERRAILKHLRAAAASDQIRGEGSSFTRRVQLLVLELVTHSDPTTRALATEILARMEVEEGALSLLLRGLSDVHKDVRRRAAMALLSKPSCAARAQEVVLELLRSGAEAEKRSMLEALSLKVEVREYPWLVESIQRLTFEGHLDTRRLALSVLIPHLDPEVASSRVMECIQSDDPCWSLFHRDLAWLLSRFVGQPTVTDFLVQQMSSERAYWAQPKNLPCRWLVRRGHRATAEASLAEALRSSESRWVAVRGNVLEVLRQMKSAAGMESFLLRALETNDEDWSEHRPGILSLFAALHSSPRRLLKATIDCLREPDLVKPAQRVLAVMASREATLVLASLLPDSGLSASHRGLVLRALVGRSNLQETEENLAELISCLDAEVAIAHYAASQIVNMRIDSPLQIDAFQRIAEHGSPHIRSTLRDRRLKASPRTEERIAGLLESGSKEVQETLLRLLDQHAGTGKLFPALRKLTSSNDAVVATLAAYRLWRFAEERRLVPLDRLTSAFHSREDRHVPVLLWALSEHPVSSPGAEELWMSLLDDESDRCFEALAALTRVKVPTERVLVRLARLSASRFGSEVRAVFQRWGKPAAAALPNLLEVYEGANSDVRDFVLGSMLAVQPLNSKVLAIFKSRLQDGVGSLYRSVGPSAKVLVPEMVKELGLTHPDVQKYLQSHGAEADIVPELIEALRKETSKEVRWEYFQTLKALRKGDPRLLPVLIESLYDRGLRGAALEALSELGAAAEPALPELEKWLNRDSAPEETALRHWHRYEEVVQVIREIREASKLAAQGGQ
ncbi:MAG: HEAT repeat domain-containing protein [Planctomycetota bacterium]